MDVSGCIDAFRHAWYKCMDYMHILGFSADTVECKYLLLTDDKSVAQLSTLFLAPIHPGFLCLGRSLSELWSEDEHDVGATARSADSLLM